MRRENRAGGEPALIGIALPDPVVRQRIFCNENSFIVVGILPCGKGLVL